MARSIQVIQGYAIRQGLGPEGPFMHYIHMPMYGPRINQRLGDELVVQELNCTASIHMTQHGQTIESLMGELVFVLVKDTEGVTQVPYYHDIFKVEGGNAVRDSTDERPSVGCFIKEDLRDNYEILRRVPWTLRAHGQPMNDAYRAYVNIHLGEEVRGLTVKMKKNSSLGNIGDVKNNCILVYGLCNGRKAQQYELVFRNEVVFYVK